MTARKRKQVLVERVMAAMDRCACARGEAQWTNGYRAAIAKSNPAEEARLYPKEMDQWRLVHREDARFKRLVQRLIPTPTESTDAK